MSRIKARKNSEASIELISNRIEITPKTTNQRDYMKNIDLNDFTFGVGPAGTGKTFLAAYKAAQALLSGDVNKIIICRPIIEAGGEKIGFLPGDLKEKCDPYLRPIFDAFRLMMSQKEFQTYLNNDTIEIAPMAYMRGRTFTKAFIICDEAQNATRDQILMLITRLGEGSKMVITGDPKQRDKREADGIEHARVVLENCPQVAFSSFWEEDIVRHPTVKEILYLWE